MSSKQRNCTIDLMRFVMTLAVVMVHIVTTFMKDDFFLLKGGTIAVEFFFILSGLLLAASADRADHARSVAQATWKTMKSKVCAIYPMWLLALLARMITRVIMGGYSLRKTLLMVEESTSSYLMLTNLGLLDSPAVIKYSWYIPVMLLCTLMLYPILFKWRKAFTYTLAPLIALFGCTYLFHSTGSLFTRDAWLGFTFSSVVRGGCEMCMGVMVYEAATWLQRRFSGRLTKTGRTLFTVVEAAVLVYVMYYVLRFLYPEVLLNLTLCFAVFLTIAYANVSWSAKIIRGRLWTWLGQFSLAVYLAQGVPSHLLTNVYGTMNRWLFVLLFFAMTFAVAFLLWYGAKLLTFLFRKGKTALLKACVQD